MVREYSPENLVVAALAELDPRMGISPTGDVVMVKVAAICKLLDDPPPMLRKSTKPVKGWRVTMQPHVTYGVSKGTWAVLEEWRRDCRDYYVGEDQPIEIERPVVLRGRYFHAGIYHRHMIDQHKDNSHD